MALDFVLRLGSPNHQLVGDLETAKSAIFVGVLNGVAWWSYLQPFLSDGADSDVKRRWYIIYEFAICLMIMLGVLLLFVGMASSATVIISPARTQVVKYMVWITKVLTGATLQFGLSVLYCCLSRLMFFGPR